MNAILSVSEQHAYAVVEPGVTFTDLYNHCLTHKLKLWPSTPSLGWGSVIGNTLDRGAGFTPTASHHENMAGLEVMLADGSLVRTGQWAKTDSPNAHLSKFNFGPSIEGLFLQSNLGVVTKMGIWLSPQPQAYMSCSFDMPEEEDVGTITEVFGEMRRNGTLPNICYCFNVVEWSAILGTRRELYDEDGPMPEWRVKEIQKEMDVGHWTVKIMLYGAKGVIQAQFDEVQRVVKERAPTGRLRGVIFEGEDGGLLDPLAVTGPHGGMFVGVPSLWSLPLVRYMLPRGRSQGGAHGAYSSIIPLDGKIMAEWYTTAKKVYQDEGFDAMCDFFMHGRHAVFVCMLCFDKMDKKQTETVDRIFYRLFEEGQKRGFSKYRAHVDHMGESLFRHIDRWRADNLADMASEQMDWNDMAYKRFVERIKAGLRLNVL